MTVSQPHNILLQRVCPMSDYLVPHWYTFTIGTEFRSPEETRGRSLLREFSLIFLQFRAINSRIVHHKGSQANVNINATIYLELQYAFRAKSRFEKQTQ